MGHMPTSSIAWCHTLWERLHLVTNGKSAAKLDSRLMLCASQWNAYSFMFLWHILSWTRITDICGIQEKMLINARSWGTTSFEENMTLSMFQMSFYDSTTRFVRHIINNSVKLNQKENRKTSEFFFLLQCQINADEKKGKRMKNQSSPTFINGKFIKMNGKQFSFSKHVIKSIIFFSLLLPSTETANWLVSASNLNFYICCKMYCIYFLRLNFLQKYTLIFE